MSNSGFVVDASATLPWCFTEEATPETEGLLERLRSGEAAIVPAHWPTEVMNGLVMAIRRRRIDRERVTRFIRALSALPIHLEVPLALPLWDSVTFIALDQQLSVYDGAYLELARRLDLPLATLDRQLQNAAKASSVQLVGRSE